MLRERRFPLNGCFVSLTPIISRLQASKDRYQARNTYLSLSLAQPGLDLPTDRNTPRVSWTHGKNSMFLRAVYHPAFAPRGGHDVAGRFGEAPAKNNLRQQSLNRPPLCRSAERWPGTSQAISSHPRQSAAATSPRKKSHESHELPKIRKKELIAAFKAPELSSRKPEGKRELAHLIR